MASSKNIAEFKAQNGWITALAGLGVLGVFFRLWQLRILPPGMSTAEASGAVLARSISTGAAHIGFHSETGFSPLWEALEAATIHLFGVSITALRVIAVLIGLLAVATTYLWVESWYDRRTAWVAAFLMAVLPWSVTMSRNISPTVFAPLVLTLLLWTFGQVVRRPGSLTWTIGFTASSALALVVGPWGWLALGITAISGVFQRKAFVRFMKSLGDTKLMSGSLILVRAGLAITVLLVAYKHFSTIAKVFSLSGSGWFGNIFRVLGMFFYSGDTNFYHNLGGEPMLNAFIALAFVAGLMVTLSRYLRARDRSVVLLFLLGLAPAIFSAGVGPNSARAALALPVICLFASIGVFYLLDLWAATFPVNSAARSLGMTAIGLLLVLTAFQSYTQYFVAWANSSQTYQVHNRSAVKASTYTNSQHNGTGITLVVTGDETPVAALLGGKAQVIAPGAIEALPNDTSRTFIITSGAHDAVVPLLEKRFAGGTIKPHLDTDGSELYYDYTYKK